MNFLAAYFRIEFLKRPPTVCLKNRIGTRRTVSRIHTPVSYISSNKFMVSCSRSRVCTLLVRLFENRVTFLKIENFPRNSSCVCAHNRLVKTFLVGKLKFSFSFFSLSSLLYRYLAKVRERVQPYEGELFINGSPKSCLATSRRTFFEHRNRGRIYSSGLCEKIDFDPEPSSTHLTKSRLLLSIRSPFLVLALSHRIFQNEKKNANVPIPTYFLLESNTDIVVDVVFHLLHLLCVRSILSTHIPLSPSARDEILDCLTVPALV